MIKNGAFVWLANNGAAGASNFPAEFAVPRGYLNVAAAKQMIGRSLWIVIARRRRSYLFGHTTPLRIDRVPEGHDAGTFILHADEQTSFRVLPSDEDDWAGWQMQPHRSRPGVFGASAADIKKIQTILGVKRHGLRQTRAEKKTAEVLRRDNVDAPFPKALNIASLGDLRWSQKSSLTPYGDIVKAAAKDSRADAMRDIASFDEVIMGVIERGYVDYRNAADDAPLVDTVLKELDLNAISAREFVAGNKTLYDMRKTAAAEKAHQSILAALVRILKDRKIKPLYSRSVDLAFKIRGALAICEIKSATAGNFDDQIRRGLVQIREYEMRFAKIHRKVSPVLIVTDIGNDSRARYFKELANHLGVRLILYSEDGIKSVFPDSIAR